MKNMIITVGAVIFMITVMGYQNQLNKLIRDKENLKYAADEAAATACMCIDEEKYSEGFLLFDKVKAREEAKKAIEMHCQGKYNPWKMNISFTEKESVPKVEVIIEHRNLKVKSIYEYRFFSQS